MPHIRGATAVAFARLMAMKLYAYRALDYLQASGGDDRRYLLFNAVQKARVSTQGVALLALLSEWSRADETYQQRIDHLRGTTPGGANGTVYLNANTVHDDGAPDTLTGGAGMDWYWAAQPQDALTDLAPGEQLN
jgi:hypothetical protein